MINSIKLFGSTLKVEVKTIKEEKELLNALGFWEEFYDKIVLNKECSEHKMKNILIHELLHAIEDYTETELGEERVSRLANAIFSLIQDNPELISWLSSPDKEV